MWRLRYSDTLMFRCFSSLPLVLLTLLIFCSLLFSHRISFGNITCFLSTFMWICALFFPTLPRWLPSLEQSPPQLRPFIQEEFMKTLEKAGPQLTSRLKGDWIGLYRYRPAPQWLRAFGVVPFGISGARSYSFFHMMMK